MPTFNGTAGNDSLTGTEGDDVLNGLGGNDQLSGLGGNDTLDGGTGVDRMDGGAGDDTFYVDDRLDEVWDTEGTNTVITSVSYALREHDASYLSPRITFLRAQAGTANIELWGNHHPEQIFGNDGNNILMGMGGADTLYGFGGNDRLNGQDSPVLSRDTMYGGPGDDLYEVDQWDTALENVGEGTDTVVFGRASSPFPDDTYVLAAGSEIENLSLSFAPGTAGLSLRGNEFANTITGNDGNNSLSGGGGGDIIHARAGNDNLNGDDGDDRLFGGAGNDLLNGGTGSDHLEGGTGNDFYFLNETVDTIQEYAGEGDDRIVTSVSYVLAAGVSVETLGTTSPTGTGAINLTGNELAQSIYGNDGNNILTSGGGLDFLVGRQGNDTYRVDGQSVNILEVAGQGDDSLFTANSFTLAAGLSIELLATAFGPGTEAINLTGNEFGQSIYGNAGDNVLTGLGGVDYLVGGQGNDRYHADSTDVISELAGAGDDWLFLSESYVLGAGVEIETLIAADQDSTDPINITGNEYGQSLYGNQGANTLSGGGGNDYLVGRGGNDVLIGGVGNDNMAGGQGNDTYYVDSAGDRIFENAGEGDDLAVAFASFALEAGQSVETIAAADSAGAASLTGNELAQSIYGNGSANVIDGGGGGDYLVGGGGADRFVFSGTPGNDAIADFVAGTDKLDFRAFGITADQVTASASGGNTVLSVDSNRDGSADFTITLYGAGAPSGGDYLF